MEETLLGAPGTKSNLIPFSHGQCYMTQGWSHLRLGPVQKMNLGNRKLKVQNWNKTFELTTTLKVHFGNKTSNHKVQNYFAAEAKNMMRKLKIQSAVNSLFNSLAILSKFNIVQCFVLNCNKKAF